MAQGDRGNHLNEQIPIDGNVSADWEEWVFEEDRQGVTRVNRITYELCVLDALRERLRCKEIWVVGAERFGNPDEDADGLRDQAG